MALPPTKSRPRSVAARPTQSSGIAKPKRAVKEVGAKKAGSPARSRRSEPRSPAPASPPTKSSMGRTPIQKRAVAVKKTPTKSSKKIVSAPLRPSALNDHSAFPGTPRALSSAVYGVPAPSSPPHVFDRLDAALDKALDNMYDFLNIPAPDSPGAAASVQSGPSDSPSAADHESAASTDRSSSAAAPPLASPSSAEATNDFWGWDKIRRTAIARGAAMKDVALDVLASVSEEIQRQSSDPIHRRALKDWQVVLGVLAVGQLAAALLRRRF